MREASNIPRELVNVPMSNKFRHENERTHYRTKPDGKVFHAVLAGSQDTQDTWHRQCTHLMRSYHSGNAVARSRIKLLRILEEIHVLARLDTRHRGIRERVMSEAPTVTHLLYPRIFFFMTWT